MSGAMNSIVDGFIRLKDRRKLEALRDDWRRMRSRLEGSSKGGFDVSPSMEQFDKEILAIEQGLRALSARDA